MFAFYVTITGYVGTVWRVRVRLSMTPFASSAHILALVMTLEALEDLVRWYWSLLKTSWEDTGDTFSSLTSVFFFCDPGPIRPGSVGDFVRGPRSLCGPSCRSSRLRSEHRRPTRFCRWIRVGMFIHCSFLPSGRWFFHGSGRCRCRPFSSQWEPSGERRHVHSSGHRPYRGRHCWCRRWYGSRLLRLVCWGYVRGAGSLCFLRCAGNSANSCSRVHLRISWLLFSVLWSPERDAHGVVEKALKVFFTLCNGLTTPVIVGLSWICAYAVLSSGTICSRRFPSA